MLGTLRFILALLVAFSHTGLTPDFHFGSMAVMVFFLIAGYVMTHSFQANFGGKLSSIPSFYVDRFFRIYPLYLVTLVLIFAFVKISGYGVLYLDAKSIWVNLSMFQLNNYTNIMNPATWSLGTEVQFYALLPFLVRFRWLKYALLPASYAIFAMATFGQIEMQLWSYKLLPGTLFFFIVGSVIYDSITDTTKAARNITLAVLAVGLIHLVALSFSPKDIDQPYSLEELVGLGFGVLMLYVLGQSKPAHRKLDNWLGTLSYPLFLAHVPVLYVFDHLRMAHGITFSLKGLVVLEMAGSLLLTIPLAFADDYFQRVRKRVQLRLTKPRTSLSP